MNVFRTGKHQYKMQQREKLGKYHMSGSQLSDGLMSDGLMSDGLMSDGLMSDG